MLNGTSILGSRTGTQTGTSFRAINPATSELLEPPFFSATPEEIDHAARLAHQAFPITSKLSGRAKAAFLRTLADSLDALAEPIIARANQETALPIPRCTSELGRTTMQLRAFAATVEDGSWLMAVIDTANPDRQPLPKPDLRSFLRPLGPVAVFGASNFPLAFSVAGGDTASAFAAGNPVVVKAHAAHPGTSELVGQAIQAAVRAHNLPEGTFSLLFDAGKDAGIALVQHPHIKAVGFTGSLPAGRALMDLCAARPEPIPCFTEMGSTNPVFLLPGALRNRGAQIASGLFGSFTLAAGQMCTKPGLVFLESCTTSQQAEAQTPFLDELHRLVAAAPVYTMLTAGIAAQYARAATEPRLPATTKTVSPFTTQALLRETHVEALLADPAQGEEIFGPTTLLVRHSTRQQLLQAAEALCGHLTATVIGTPEDLIEYQDLIAILERKAGRLIVNGYPTGVEVANAMVHGGPYPATSDGRFTSVGAQAIYRFTRPICYQNFPDEALPDELKRTNPLNLLRLVDGRPTRDPA
jgi:alpha-ketoglutaric semialdehyde dehydrogenase